MKKFPTSKYTTFNERLGWQALHNASLVLARIYFSKYFINRSKVFATITYYYSDSTSPLQVTTPYSDNVLLLLKRCSDEPGATPRLF